MPPTAPAAPVTRIGLSCLCFVVMSLTLGYVQKTNWRRGARAGTNGRRHTPGRFARLVCFPSTRARGDVSGAAEFLWGGGLSKAVPVSPRTRLLAADRSASSVLMH